MHPTHPRCLAGPTSQVESLELLAKRLVETLQVSVDEAERLKSMVNRTGSTDVNGK